MSKQKRTSPSHAPATRAPSEQQEEASGELDFGNQAAQEQLGGPVQVEPVSLDVVRDAAIPMVERAILALQITPRREAQVARFVEILQRSRLPEERKALLQDHLLTDQTAAQGIRDAVERWFAVDSEATRDALVGALDSVIDALAGHAGDGGWVLPDGRTLSLGDEALTGSLSSRAEALVSELVEELGPGGLDGAGHGVGAAVRGFCRDVQLALLWDEEEEEEALPGDYAAEESGV